jgi:hypothetical protein
MIRTLVFIALFVSLAGTAFALSTTLPQSTVQKPLSNSHPTNMSTADCIGLGGEVDLGAAALKACNGGAQCVRSNPAGMVYRMCIVDPK